MIRTKLAALAAGAMAVTLPGVVFACTGCGDGDSFVQLAPHPFTGQCAWRSVNSSNNGIEATLYGYAVVGDVTGAGVTVRCWLEYTSDGANVPNTTTQMGAPGSVAATTRQITVPLGVSTQVCTYAEALFITPDPAQTYKTPWCTLT
jgi:hypothetical protein